MKLKLVVLALAALTAAYPRWLELLGLDPDHGSGLVEALITGGCVLAVIALTASVARRVD